MCFAAGAKQDTSAESPRRAHGPTLENGWIDYYLLTQLQFRDHLLIAFVAGAAKVIEQFPASSYHAQQTTARGVILLELLQMFSEMIDAVGQQGDLHVRGPCVLGVYFETLDHRCLFSCFHILYLLFDERVTLPERIYVASINTGFTAPVAI